MPACHALASEASLRSRRSRSGDCDSLVACLQRSGGDQHQRLVRHLPLGLGLLDLAGFQRRHRADRVLRLILDPRHGAALVRRAVRLPAPMERGACAYGECATRHHSPDQHGRDHLPDGERRMALRTGTPGPSWLDQTLVERESARHARPKMDAAFVTSGGGGPPAAVLQAETLGRSGRGRQLAV